MHAGVPGLCTAIDYYKLPLEACAGTSVPAAEHSTITSWTKAGSRVVHAEPEAPHLQPVDRTCARGEKAAFENMLKQYPEGIVAVVSDSYARGSDFSSPSFAQRGKARVHGRQLDLRELRISTTLAKSSGAPSCRFSASLVCGLRA